MGNFQSMIKPELDSSSNFFVIRPMTSDDRVCFDFNQEKILANGSFQGGIYALCTTICYQDDIDELLRQHEEILADQFVEKDRLMSFDGFCLE